ncbi:hypothetical protein IAT40_004302 [Kwoniella sp. CBS 6097]
MSLKTSAIPNSFPTHGLVPLDLSVVDLTPLSSPLSFDRVPDDIIHLLFQTFDHLPPSSLASLSQSSWDMYERFTPVLYRKVEVHKGNLGSVFSGLDVSTYLGNGISSKREAMLARRRKEGLLEYTRELVVNDLPSLDMLSRVSSAKCLAALRTSSSISLARLESIDPTAGDTYPSSYFATIHPTLFPALDTLVFTDKAILALADLYNASSWGDSPSLLPSNTLLRSIKDHLNPERLVCHYPQVMVGLHMHSCIEEVIAYLTSSWDLESLQWYDLPRSMVGSIPKARRLRYQFGKCQSRRSSKPSDTLKGCPVHYDHVSLTTSAFVDHLIKTGALEEAGLTLEGLGCMFSLNWERVVEEAWSRMGVLDGEDWKKMEFWRRADITLLA